jgi:hypothetical protein
MGLRGCRGIWAAIICSDRAPVGEVWWATCERSSTHAKVMQGNLPRCGPGVTKRLPMAKNTSGLGLGLAALLLFVGLRIDYATACSLVSLAASMEESIRISNGYWIATALIGAICVTVALYRRRWIFSFIIVAAVLIFHPSWTVWPSYGPDCAFANVEASQAALVVVCLLLSNHLFQILRTRRRLP